MTLEEFAAKFRGPAKRSGQRLMVFCSSHEDESRQSLALSRGDDGKLLAHCYAGCQTEAILAAVGLRITDLFPDRPTANGTGHVLHAGGREIVATYDYVDGEGTVRYQVVRFAPKDFRQRRPDGQGGWIWNLQGVARVLYRLPDLAEQARVFLCEGEKDADALAALGVTATTVAGGAEAWRDDYARQLVALGAREVVIPPDQDKAGEKYATTAARACIEAGLDVRILRLPCLGPKGDAFDWITAGGTREALEILVARTTPVTLAELTAEATTPAAAAEEAPTKELRGAAIFSVELAETDWMIRNVFSVNHQHMVVGASQSCKSWVVEDVAIAVAHPEISLVLGQPVSRHGRVCFESWENGQAEDVRRFQKGIRGHGLTTASEDLILLSDTRPTLSDEGYFARRRRELREWGVLLYVIDSLSLAAGMELNDNTAFTAWWRDRVKPLLDDGITVLWTHLRGHAKAGVTPDRDSASRGATQIRALSTGVLEVRQLTEVLFTLRHNKHRDGGAVPFGTLALEGGIDDPFVRLVVRADAAGQEGKAALARLALQALGQAQAAAGAEPLTRKVIEQALNAPTKPKAERVSRKTYEAVLAQMVADDLFHPAKRGNAETWTWIGPATDDATDTEATDDAE